MKIVIIDGQGGGLGKLLTARMKKELPQAEITAVGTNSIATAAMMKAGADRGATGENAVLVCCRDADVIVGPVGIVIADALLGEITPKMARAIGQARAKRVLIPLNLCDNRIVGAADKPMSWFVDQAVAAIKEESAPACANA